MNPNDQSDEARMARLFKAMPGMIKQLDGKRRASKAARANGASTKPTPCPICGTMFEKWAGWKQSNKACEPCQKNLDEGFAALVSTDGRYSFSRFPTMPPEWAGDIVSIPNEVMDKVKEDFEKNKPGKAGDN